MEACLIESSSDDTMDDDTDFVLLANDETRTLDTDRYHLFTLISTLLGMVPADTVVRVATTYLRSASTRFRSDMLARLSQQPIAHFTDAQLHQAYVNAPDETRSVILKTCFGTKNRQGFFELLNEPKYIFLCSSERVRLSLPGLFGQGRMLEG